MKSVFFSCKKWLKDNYKQLLSAIFLLLIFFLFKYLLNGEESFSWIIYAFLYLHLLFLVTTLPDYPVFNVIKVIVAIPTLLFILIAPIWGFLLAVNLSVISILFVVVPFVHLVIESVTGWDILFATKLYIILTLSSIIFVFLGEKIITFFTRTISSTGASEPEIQNQIALNKSILNNKTSTYLIYTLFLFILIIYNLFSLNQVGFIDFPVGTEKAIVQSFITFLAFERLVSNKNKIPIFKEVKKYILKSWIFSTGKSQGNK